MDSEVANLRNCLFNNHNYHNNTSKLSFCQPRRRLPKL
uniref:Uncharacterized protein n=1 Tax=Rhizophora mucronata TaxID=61149 RepID=A0A2P2QU06_RHIMU